MDARRWLLLGLSAGVLQIGIGCNSGSGSGGSGSGRGAGSSEGTTAFGPGFGGPSAQPAGQRQASDPTEGGPGLGNPPGARTAAPARRDPTDFGQGLGAPGEAPAGGANPGGAGGPLPPADARLSDLTPGQVTQLCAAIQQRALQAFGDEAFRRISCTASAVAEAVRVDASGAESVDVALCEALVADCLQRGEPDAFGMAECDPSELAACDATVGQQLACSEALLGQVQRLASLLSCEGLSDPSMVELGALPPECAALAAACAGPGAGAAGSGL